MHPCFRGSPIRQASSLRPARMQDVVIDLRGRHGWELVRGRCARTSTTRQFGDGVWSSGNEADTRPPPPPARLVERVAPAAVCPISGGEERT